MRRYILSFVVAFAAVMSVHAMSYSRARQEALYLTDKMAYELNLNDQQYNDAYEINLDYLMSVNNANDLYGPLLSYRLADLRYILYDWQYDLLCGVDYFLRPVMWHAGGWFFPIYNHYHHGHFYYARPRVYYSYHGGHGPAHYHGGGYYVNRRPAWNGGLRDHHMGRVPHSPNVPGRNPGIGGQPPRGGVAHNPGMGGQPPRNDAGRGNSFNRSSSRSGGSGMAPGGAPGNRGSQQPRGPQVSGGSRGGAMGGGSVSSRGAVGGGNRGSGAMGGRGGAGGGGRGRR